MYAYLEGTIAEKGHNELVIDVNGIGYRVICDANTLSAAPPAGERMRVYTWLSVREDALELIGFYSREERIMFHRLNGITGIGPRTALGVLGSMPLRDLTLAIVTGDIASLSRAPGIGKKTAQRIALELKEQVAKEDLSIAPEGAALGAASQMDDPVSEALLALQALGYSQTEAVKAVAAVRDKSDQADELVRLALRGMK